VSKSRVNDPTEIDTEHGYSEGLTDALRRLRMGRVGPPTLDDRPPPSLFPVTRAARAALRYARQYDS
jgi:hypothetical protein